ncbi:MAG TPA: alkaline phosphatase family protein [Clostridia bacterium]|nr:alkaline phosphatase family protein [Clostridia bacterium]
MVLVVLENQNYRDVVGSPSMPYLNGLIGRGGLATNYFANTHPSIGNYFVMTSGQVATNDEGFMGTLSIQNVAQDLTAAGKSWKIYAQALPSVGYLGPDVYPYVRHHNPFAYFDTVVNDTVQQQNIVEMAQFSSDVSTGNLPDFAMLVPDQQHNAHDCPGGGSNCSMAVRLAAADTLLRSNLQEIIAAGDPKTLIVITFDEAADDNTNGGGQVATVLIGPRVKSAFRSTTLYQHESLYRLILEVTGNSSLPPAAASATGMGEFLK